MNFKIWSICLLIFISCQSNNEVKSNETVGLNEVINHTDTNFVKGDSVYIVETSERDKITKKERFFKGKLNGFSEYYYEDGIKKRVEYVLLADNSVLTNQIIYYDKNDEIIPDSSMHYFSNLSSDTVKYNEEISAKFDVSQNEIDSFVVEYYFYPIDTSAIRIVTPKKGQTNILFKEKISSDYKKGMNRIEGYARVKEFYADSTLERDSLEFFDILISEKFFVE